MAPGFSSKIGQPPQLTARFSEQRQHVRLPQALDVELCPKWTICTVDGQIRFRWMRHYDYSDKPSTNWRRSLSVKVAQACGKEICPEYQRGASLRLCFHLQAVALSITSSDPKVPLATTLRMQLEQQI